MLILPTSPSLGALILRLGLGIMFLAHGLLKLLVFTPAGTAGFFQSVGLPGFLGPLVMAAEIVGGLAIIAGLAGRYVSAALIPVLLGSIVTVHGANGWQFGATGGGWEYPAFLAVAALAHVVIGDGAYAIGRFIFRGQR